MSIDQLFDDPSWHAEFQVDPNTGGDGQRIRLLATSHSFRKLAALLTTMADKVDDTSHPASETGWHLALNPDDLPQLTLTNASIMTLNCEPTPKTD